MPTRALIWLLIPMLLLFAVSCSESEKIAPSEQPVTQNEDDVWATQRQPLNRAEAVEQQLQEQSRQQLEEIDKQGQ